MIISHKHKYVYISIPRTGSASMFIWLRDHYDGEIFILHPFSEHGKFDWDVPEECKSYFIFAMVRNPYERYLSWWKRSAYRSSAFHDFVRARFDTVGITCRAVTQKTFILNSGAQKFIHLENLEELKTLPFVSEPLPEFPWTKKTEKIIEPNLDTLNVEEEQAVWDCCSEDFDFLGYKRLIIKS